jgi:hypothetical protein
MVHGIIQELISKKWKVFVQEKMAVINSGDFPQ